METVYYSETFIRTYLAALFVIIIVTHINGIYVCFVALQFCIFVLCVGLISLVLDSVRNW